MNERTPQGLKFAIVALIGCGIGLFAGIQAGLHDGRAEQAKIDAAKPPVVKEVPQHECPDGQVKGDLLFYTDGTWRYICVPAPKPSKGSKPFEYECYDWQDRRYFPCAAAAPKPQRPPKMCEMPQPGATLYWPPRADGTCHRADWGDGSWKPELGQPEPWDCGDGKLTTAPCPASAKPQSEHGEWGMVKWVPNCVPTRGTVCYWCAAGNCITPSEEEIKRHAAEAKPQPEVPQ